MQSTKAGFEFTTFRMLGESEICARYPLVYLVTLAMLSLRRLKYYKQRHFTNNTHVVISLQLI